MSQGAFGKHARNLTLAESALIAGLVQAPSALSPWSNLDGARRRSDTVLARMVVDRRHHRGPGPRRACRAPDDPAVSVVASSPRHGYAKEYLRQQFRDRFGGDQPPDWEVHTTLQPALQDAAEQAVADGLARLGIGGLQAALVALDPADRQRACRRRRTRLPSVAVQPRHSQPPAARVGVQAVCLRGRRSSRGCRRSPRLSGLASMAPLGTEEWTPRNVSARVEDRRHAAPGLRRVEQPGRRGPAAEGGRARDSARWQADAGAGRISPTSRRWPSAAGWSRRWR